MEKESIGQKLRRLRIGKKLSQPKLAKLSGVSREYISNLETGKQVTISVRKAEQLARGLTVSPSVFFNEEPGYSPLSEKLKVDGIIQIPVYTEFPFHAGESAAEPAEFVYQRAAKDAGKHIEGYIVRGNCLDPVINEGDTIIVDREREIENGDIVACQISGEMHVARLKKIAGEMWLENNHGHHKMESCQASAVVVAVTRRLK